MHCVVVVLQGVTYPNSLHLIDVTQDLPLAHQEGRGHSALAHWGGYALVRCSTLMHMVGEAEVD